jgi:hypothetical protein
MKSNTSKTIYLSSKNRSTGSANSFITLLRDPVDASGIRLNSLSLPNVFYNITSSNNVLTVTDTGGTASVTITTGFYDLTGLYAALKTVLDSNGTLNGTYTLTQNTVSYKSVISCTVNYSISTSTALSRLLGFTSTTATGLTATSENIPNINIGTIYIATDIALNTYVDTNIRNVIAKATANETFGSYLELPYDDPQYIQFKSPLTLSQIGLTLTNEDGAQLDTNGVEWSCIIELME